MRLDNIFIFEDGSAGIIDYESDYDYLRQNAKYLGYIARIVERFRRDGNPLHKLHLIVLYTANVKKESVKLSYDIGCLQIEKEAGFLSELDADTILSGIRRKMQIGESLNEIEQMQLIILPLARKSRKKKLETLKEGIEIAKNIADEGLSVLLLSAMVVFSDKIIDATTSENVRRWIQMTKVGRLFEEEKIEALKALEQKKDEERVRELRAKDEELKAKDEEKVRELRAKDEELKAKDESFATKLMKETNLTDDEILKIVDVFSPLQIREMRKRVAG